MSQLVERRIHGAERLCPWSDEPTVEADWVECQECHGKRLRCDCCRGLGQVLLARHTPRHPAVAP